MTRIRVDALRASLVERDPAAAMLSALVDRLQTRLPALAEGADRRTAPALREALAVIADELSDLGSQAAKVTARR